MVFGSASRETVLWIMAGAFAFTFVFLGALIWLRTHHPEKMKRLYDSTLRFYDSGGQAAGKALAGPWPKQDRSDEQKPEDPS